MADVEQYADEILKIVALSDEFSKTLRSSMGGSLSWGVGEVVNSYKSMFDRFCPYKVGDRVQLKETVDVRNAPGWESCAHFLKKGAEATVRSRGYRDGYFCFGIEFDRETWVDRLGVEQPVSQKSVFSFRENSLLPEGSINDE